MSNSVFVTFKFVKASSSTNVNLPESNKHTLAVFFVISFKAIVGMIASGLFIIYFEASCSKT